MRSDLPNASCSYNIGSDGGLWFHIRLAKEVARYPGALWFIWHSCAVSNPTPACVAGNRCDLVVPQQQALQNQSPPPPHPLHDRCNEKVSCCTDRAMLIALNTENVGGRCLDSTH